MSANNEAPRPVRGIKLRFSSKSPEGGAFGTIMLATLYCGKQAIWHDAAFLPYNHIEVWEAFWEYEPQVFGSANNAEARREMMRNMKAPSSKPWWQT